MKKTLFLFLLIATVAIGQRRSGIQDYATVAALQAETLTPQQNDKVFIKANNYLYTWNSSSTATHDGISVIKQTNINTGRFLLLATDKSAVGLGNVDNTSDANKPVSTAQQTALNARILSVDNVATLKTITGVAGQIVTTKGYYVDGDGGGNSYYWHTTSTETDNGGTIIKATATSTGRWLTRNESTEITVKQFGAKGDNTADDTTPISKALTFAVENSKVLVFQEGEYKVTNTLYNTPNNTGNRNLYIRLSGNVKITVPTGNAEINTPLISFGHDATTNVSILGNTLTVQLNNRCSGFLEIRNNGIVSGNYYTTTGGELNISASSIVIKKAYAGSGSNKTSFGIYVLGSFTKTTIQNLTVDSVSRVSAAGGESKALAVQSTRGFVHILNCKFSNVLSPTGYYDADGLAVFGLQEDINVTNSFRDATVIVEGCIFTDNQGRNAKFQTSNATVQNCQFYRKNIVGIQWGHDLDFQFGNGKVFGCTFIYKKNGGVSPLGSGFIPVAFQELLSNREMHAIARDNTFYTEISIRSPFYIYTYSGASSSIIDIENNKVIGILTLSTGTTIDYGFCQFNAGDLYTISGTMSINLIGNSCYSSSVPLLSYSSLTNSNLSTKLSFRLINNINTNASVNQRIFAPISGGYITSIDRFQITGNNGYSIHLTSGLTVDLAANKLIPNTEFVLDLSTNTVNNKPSLLSTSGYATFKITGQWDGGKPTVEIYEETGGNGYLYKSSGLGWKRVTLN